MQLDDDNSDDAKSDASSELWEDEPDLDKQPQLDPVARLANKKADPAFGPLHRSKGFFWLATRPSMSGEWSQAGVMLSLSGGDKWLCEQDEETWPEHPECVFLSSSSSSLLEPSISTSTHALIDVSANVAPPSPTRSIGMRSDPLDLALTPPPSPAGFARR